MFMFSNLVRLTGPAMCTSPLTRLFANNLVLNTVFVTASCIASPVARGKVLVCNITVNFLAIMVHAFNTCPRNVSFTVFVVGTFAPLVGACYGPGHFKRMIGG